MLGIITHEPQLSFSLDSSESPPRK